MDQEPDVIRQEIEETRSSLAEKIETLEHQVRATVQNVKDSVEGTIENVKETVEGTVDNVKSSVQETVHSVQDTFDMNAQVQRHPWAMLGGSFVAGFVVGNLIQGRRHDTDVWGHDRWMNRLTNRSPASRNYQEYERPREESPARASEPGLVDTLRNQFSDEIGMAKGMIIGALMGVARDIVKQNLPKLAPQIDELMNSATAKMGGEPIRRPLVDPQPQTTR
jgi:ElaB/YqjD/DUF883 family membrane-anchored ribosome-binding protein